MQRILVVGVVLAVATATFGCNDPSEPPSTSTSVQGLTCDATCQQRVNQILANDEIIFTHDHLRDPAHLQGAIAGHVTAMVIEMTVDQLKWVDRQDLPPGLPPDPNQCQNNPCAHEVTTCCGGQQAYDCFYNATHSCPVGADPTLERSWFDTARNDLVDGGVVVTGQARIVTKVEDIDSAKASGDLGIIIGTEGALVTCTQAGNCPPGGVLAGHGMLANVESLYQLGWRKAQLRHGSDNAFTDATCLTQLGKQFVAALNRRGIVVDTMHLRGFPQTCPSNANVVSDELDDVLGVANAPLLVSHQWQRGMTLTTSDAYLQKEAWSGGGHGVIALNALGAYYTQAYANGGSNVTPSDCPEGYSTDDNQPTASLQNYLDRVNCMIRLVGIDHVAIGPDFMPGGEGRYAVGGGGAQPDLSKVPDLVTALVTYKGHNGNLLYSDDDIRKILGGNLRDFYQRVWDPTHGHAGGPANFRLCASGSPTHPQTDPVCLAAAANHGQGDLHHRAISCQHMSGYQPVALQLSYLYGPLGHELDWGSWQYRDLNNTLQYCHEPANLHGSTLVVSWPTDQSAPFNGHLSIDNGLGSCDVYCQAARTSAGSGTEGARALSCATPKAPGIVGLQLSYASSTGTWGYYDIVPNLNACIQNSPPANWQGTWIVDWGQPHTSNAYVRLCDDNNTNTHQACINAAANNGAGTADSKPLNCLNSTATDPTCSGRSCGASPTGAGGVVALQLTYMVDGLTGTGRWFYWDQSGQPHHCVHGSVLVATTIP